VISSRAYLIGLIAVVRFISPSAQANADSINSRIAIPRLIVAPTSARQGNAPVRVRLVDQLPTPGSAASVSLAAGSSEAFVVDVKQAALSVQLLAAAFHMRAALAARRAMYPTGDIVVTIPASVAKRAVSPQDRAAFEPLVAELRAHVVGDVVEVRLP
jgi:hypothetical protein